MEIHNPSHLPHLPATMASGEQIQAIVNAQLAVANNELQQSLNQKFATANMELQQSLDQRFGSFKSEIDASIASIASDLSDLRNKLNEVTRHAEITYESQKKEMGEAIERMNVNINRADEEAVKNGQKINSIGNLEQSRCSGESPQHSSDCRAAGKSSEYICILELHNFGQ